MKLATITFFQILLKFIFDSHTFIWCYITDTPKKNVSVIYNQLQKV